MTLSKEVYSDKETHAIAVQEEALLLTSQSPGNAAPLGVKR